MRPGHCAPCREIDGGHASLPEIVDHDIGGIGLLFKIGQPGLVAVSGQVAKQLSTCCSQPPTVQQEVTCTHAYVCRSREGGT